MIIPSKENKTFENLLTKLKEQHKPERIRK